jgi:excisionase family DNA binding protein
MDTNIDDIISEAEAANVLGVKIATLRTWATRRKGPPRIKVGRSVRYRRQTLIAWMTAREVSPEVGTK